MSQAKRSPLWANLRCERKDQLVTSSPRSVANRFARLPRSL